MSIVEDARPTVEPGQLRWIVYGLSAAGLALSLYACFGGGPMVAAVALVIPFASVGLALTAPECFETKLRGGARGFNPWVGGGAFGMLGVIWGPDLVSLSSAFIAALFLAAAMFATGFVLPTRTRLSGAVIYFALTLAVLGGVYGFCGFRLADVKFDPSPAQPFQPTVTEQHVRHGKYASYELTLTPWGPMTQSDSVDVSSALYDQVSVGSQVCVGLHPGALGVAWYVVSACSAPAAGGA